MKRFILNTLLVTICFLTTSNSLKAQCQADFSYMQNGPTTVFSDLSTVSPSWSTNYSVSWFWDFGDGNTSTQQNPIHTYINGIYAPCLTVTYFDSTIINYCISVSCDSILIGNGPSASWDCGTSGCFDPGTGNGQYSSLSSCQAACTVTPSWDCNPNTLGCYDPGTGLGQYTTLSSCQSVCSTGSGVLCDSIVVSGSQFQLTMQVNNFNSIIDYWITTAPDGTVLGEDSMWNMHNVFNPANDTIITCITYQDFTGMNTCCVEWIWDASSGVWARMSTTASINQFENYKELIKVVDVLGKESMINLNKILFFIYNDGTIEKKIYK